MVIKANNRTNININIKYREEKKSAYIINESNI
jgi:hypothetical protein